MADEVTCPYCNAVVAGPTLSERTTCSRCGESFVSAGRLSEGVPLPQRPSSIPPSLRYKTRWPIYVVGALFVLGLLVALGQYFQPFADSGTPSGTPKPPRVIVKPAELPGLGYIPESCEAILAIQLPAFLEKMGPEAEEDPVEAISKLGFPKSMVESIDSASGVGLKNVEQMVVGIGFEKGAFPPQLVVVVHTREPYDIDRLIRERKGITFKKHDRTLHTVKPDSGPEVQLWAPNNRILIGTLLTRDFENVPMEPRKGIDKLKPGVARLLNGRIAPDAVFWMAAASDQWAKYVRPYTWLPGTPWTGRNDLIAPAERLRALTISIPQDPEKRVEVRIDEKNAESAKKLREVFRDRFSGEEIVVGGEAEVVVLDTAFEPKRVGSMLNRLVGDKK